MNVLLQFLFDTESLKKYVREDWMQLYDYTYIDEKILAGIERNLPNVAEILVTVEKRATGKAVSTLTQSSLGMAEAAGKVSARPPSQPEAPEKRITRPEPFNITKPKPKVIEVPQELPREVKARPVPKNIYTKDLKQIEQDKIERRNSKINMVKKQYEDSKMKKFDLKTEQRPSNLDRVRTIVEDARRKELRFD